MTHYAFDPVERWYAGPVADDAPSSTPEQPPAVGAESPTVGDPWPRWWKYAWMIEAYSLPPAPPPPPPAYAFDADGWYAGEVPVGTPNSIGVKPDITNTTTTPGEARARLEAGTWVVRAFPAPPPPPPSWSDQDLPAEYHWIDVGPFFDRFGLKALSVTSSTDPQVQGLITLIMPRQYVNLKRADLPSLMDLLVSKGLITAEEKASILSPITTEYERHIKGLANPV